MQTTQQIIDAVYIKQDDAAINHLTQELEYSKIQINNLKSMNVKFIRTIRNLQSYRVYVAHLLAKQNRTKDKVKLLVKELKSMQNIIRKKNEIINRKKAAYEISRLQTAHFIKESYGI